MPIEPIGAGDNPRMDWRKVNEIIMWINAFEKVIINPSTAGKAKLPGMIDLSGFATKDEVRQAGVPI